MIQNLDQFLPILSTIPSFTITAALLQSASVAVSQRKLNQFEQALRYEIALLNQKIGAHKINIDKEYVTSEAFQANFIHALRAVETAQSEEKLRMIAAAFAGCAIESSLSESTKVICMRYVEQISVDEAVIISEILKSVNDHNESGVASKSKIFTDEEGDRYLYRGLVQIGLLRDETSDWGDITTEISWYKSTSLADKLYELFQGRIVESAKY